MKTANHGTTAPTRRTKICFCLEDVMTEEQAARFSDAAKKAGVSPTEHFVNLKLRLPQGNPKHAA